MQVATGLARSFVRQGFTVLPWCPAPGEGDCPRTLAILADACRTFPDSDFQSPGPEVPALFQTADLTVALTPPSDGAATLSVATDDLGIDLQLPGGGPASLPHPRIDALIPEIPPEIAALPLYRPGLPRYGVISVPHIEHFGDYLVLRGAEWIATPTHGKFDAVFFPLTSHPESDREWLSLQGLDEWLFTQRALGCKLYSTGTPLIQHTTDLPRETLLSPAALSAVLGVRLPAPLPDDHVLEALADWWDGSDGAAPLTDWLISPPARIV